MESSTVAQNSLEFKALAVLIWLLLPFDYNQLSQYKIQSLFVWQAMIPIILIKTNAMNFE